jgi:hypothetical protein
MRSLILLFLLVPLYFSHVFAPFGLVIWEGSSFERQKWYLAIILLISAICELLFTRRTIFFSVMWRSWKLLASLILIPLLGILFSPDRDIVLFFLGTFEKNHGYIWFVWLILLFLCLRTLSGSEYKRLIVFSTLWACIVATISLIEYLAWGSLFFESMTAVVWWEARSISTLGNPNYVAGYLLMHLPQVLRWNLGLRAHRIGWWVWLRIIQIVFLWGLIATGSYIGIFLSAIFLVFFVLSRISLSSIMRISLLIGVFVFSSILLYNRVDEQKISSLKSRTILMDEIIQTAHSFPLYASIWYGPESIFAYFEWPRSPHIDAWFPPSSAIDSSHNIFVDVLFQYGYIIFLLLLFLLLQHIQKLEWDAQISILLGLLFLSLNVTVTVHMMSLLLFLSAVKANRNQDM